MATVLVVDDNDLVRKALELALRRMGHHVTSAATPATALALASADPPDLAVLDFGMPGMNGATLLVELRRALGDRCPRIVFISGALQEDVRGDTAGLGVDGYVTKPFHLTDLQRVVDGALAARSSTGGTGPGSFSKRA